MDVLRTIPFDKVDIEVFLIEVIDSEKCLHNIHIYLCFRLISQM